MLRILRLQRLNRSADVREKIFSFLTESQVVCVSEFKVVEF